MKFAVRQRTALSLPGVVGTARVDRRTQALLPRLRPGDVAVVDHLDLDRSTAQALVDAGVSAVVDASPLISGRYPNLGPEVLADAGVAMVDGVGHEALARIQDGAQVRIHDGSVYAGERLLGAGRQLDPDRVTEEMDRARSGLVTQLQTFTHNSTEFLRREQDVLLHGRGLPRLATRVAGRPVVVVVRGHEHDAELEALETYLREQHPVLVGVGAGADVLRAAGLSPDVVVIDASADAADMPTAKALRAARDVVLRIDRGQGRGAFEQLERLGVRPLLFESGASPEDAGVLLAHAADASLIVAVGMNATLDEFLDQQRPGLASTYLTRLKVGPRLVDAAAVPQLYAGRVRPRHLLLVMLSGLIALAAAVGVTPVGQEWADSLATALADLVDSVQGLLS